MEHRDLINNQNDDFKYIFLFINILYLICNYKRNKKVNQGKILLNLLFFIVPLFIAFFLVSPSVLSLICNNNFENWFYNEFGMKLDTFTMGRITTLNYVIDSNRTNRGLGSISDFLAKARMINPYLADDLHNDIMRIYLEGTVVSLWLMVINYFGITKKNLYNYLLVLFAFLVMFSSHLLTSCIFWIFALLFLSSNNLRESEKNEN